VVYMPSGVLVLASKSLRSSSCAWLTIRIFNPAAIVLSKQLPLFFAELQMLEGGAGAGSDKVFGLYEVTGRLGAMWNDLCPKSVPAQTKADQAVSRAALRLTRSLSPMSSHG
jgi:hypothetical protein